MNKKKLVLIDHPKVLFDNVQEAAVNLEILNEATWEIHPDFTEQEFNEIKKSLITYINSQYEKELETIKKETDELNEYREDMDSEDYYFELECLNQETEDLKEVYDEVLFRAEEIEY